MKTVTAEYLVSRWEDRHRVQNLMGIYSQHHLVKGESEIFTALWSTAQDVSLATNEGYYVGRDAVEGYYAAKALYLGDFGFHTVDHDDYIYLDTGLTVDQTEAPDIWTATSDNAYGIPNVVSMTVEESTENASLLSDIGTYVSTWTLQAITGDQELTEESFAEFRTTLEDQLHIDQCIANKQAALDCYNLR